MIKRQMYGRAGFTHPGAQLTLFEAEDGRRYTLWVTNPASQPARLAR